MYYLRFKRCGPWKKFILRLCIYKDSKFISCVGFLDKHNGLCGINLERLLFFKKRGLSFVSLKRYHFLCIGLGLQGFYSNFLNCYSEYNSAKQCQVFNLLKKKKNSSF